MQRPVLFVFFSFLFCVSALPSISVKDYGALGDGKTLDTRAIQTSIRVLHEKGGGTLTFPKGTYLTGAFNLTSHLTVQIDPQATILGVRDEDQFPVIPPLPSYGHSRDFGYARHQALIYALGCVDITVKGGGKIHGNGDYWWDRRSEGKLKHGRPRLIEFQDCRQIELGDLTLEDAGFWTVHPVYCEDVWIHDLTIRAPFGSPNTDGIDPDSSRNVLIERCHVSCADDHIAIKSGLDEAGFRYNRPCANVTVRDCVFTMGSGISIGSETSGGIRDIYIYNNTVRGPAVRGLYIKTAPQRGNVIENVHYWDNRLMAILQDPICISTHYGHQDPRNFTMIPAIRNIHYRNIHSELSVKTGKLQCMREKPCHGLHFEHVHLKYELMFWWTCAHAHGTQHNVHPPIDCLKKG